MARLARQTVWGGFLRSHNAALGLNYDFQYAYRLDVTKGEKLKGGNWAHFHKKAQGNAAVWKAQINEFIKQRKPNNAASIWGGLSRGKDFHFWVRKGTSNCTWKVKAMQLGTNSASARRREGRFGGHVRTMAMRCATPPSIVLVLAGLLVGCGGAADPSGEAADDDGTGGAGAAASTGGGGTGGSGGPGCDCGYYERCDDGVCHDADTLLFELREFALQLEDGSVDWESGELFACGYRQIAPFVPATPVAEEGDCAVYQTSPNTPPSENTVETFTPDAGSLSVTTATAGSHSLELAASGTGCLGDTIEDPFVDFAAPGEAVQLSVQGGAVFPAAEASPIAAPPPILTGPSAVTPGQDALVTWSGSGDANATVSLTSSDAMGNSTSIVCFVPDSGSVTVPGSLTSYLSSNPVYLGAGVSRFIEVVQQPDAMPVMLRFRLLTSASRPIGL